MIQLIQESDMRLVKHKLVSIRTRPQHLIFFRSGFFFSWTSAATPLTLTRLVRVGGYVCPTRPRVDSVNRVPCLAPSLVRFLYRTIRTSGQLPSWACLFKALEVAVKKMWQLKKLTG